jgi:uncharacterized protein involved in tolerance to divalent cations
MVKDVLQGLERLGVAARERAPQTRRGAVTGSVGKTSVTQAILAGLKLAGRAHSSVKSYNNHIGVPLTLARMPRDTERAVFEIGMNHEGEIRPLTRMVRPHAVVVTTVGTEEQALDIAHHLVRNRLAACVNILPAVRSVFRWKGRVNDDSEFMLMVKTVRPKFEAVRKAMKEMNAYELPEIVGFPATFADPAFAKWVGESTRGKPDADEEEPEQAIG